MLAALEVGERRSGFLLLVLLLNSGGTEREERLQRDHRSLTRTGAGGADSSDGMVLPYKHKTRSGNSMPHPARKGAKSEAEIAGSHWHSSLRREGLPMRSAALRSAACWKCE